MTAVNYNIETNNQDRNQKNMIRVYLFHPSINIAYAANMFTLFKLDIDY